MICKKKAQIKVFVCCRSFELLCRDDKYKIEEEEKKWFRPFEAGELFAKLLVLRRNLFDIAYQLGKCGADHLPSFAMHKYLANMAEGARCGNEWWYRLGSNSGPRTRKLFPVDIYLCYIFFFRQSPNWKLCGKVYGCWKVYILYICFFFCVCFFSVA